MPAVAARHDLRRQRFADGTSTPVEAADARRFLTLLLAQDGSTTRLCEHLAGPVELLVRRQEATRQVPPLVREQLPGERFLERITCLAAHGEVMMDNLSYIALDGLEPDIERALHAGDTPIGHLLARWWVRRETVDDRGGELAARLWREVGQPDPAATRCYRIDTPERPRMLITETYRRGMRTQGR